MRSILFTAGLLPAAALVPFTAAAQPFELDPIVISANRSETEAARTGASVSVLTGAQLETDGRPFVLQQITDLPGVTVQQNGPPGTVSGFAVRGLPQQYVRVQVEGIEISDPTGPQVAPSLSGLLVDDVSRIEVLKGSQSALYGGQAVAGVISITGPRATEPGFENRFIFEGGSFSTFRGAYSLSGLNDRGEFNFTLARFQTDGFSAAEEADGNTEDDGYETTRLSGYGRAFVNDQTDVFASGFWQREDVDFDDLAYDAEFNSYPVDSPSTADKTTWGLRAGVDFTSEGGVGTLLAVSYFDVDSATVADLGVSTNDTSGGRTRVEYLGAFGVSEEFAVQWGADYAYETSKTDSQSAFGPDSTDDWSWIGGGFVQSNWTPTDAVAVNAAARLDEHSEYGLYPTGRLTVAWLPAPNTTIRGSLGTGFRAPSNYELYSRYGNPDLEPETSLSADIGLAQSFAGGRGQAGATLFWIEVEDLIEFGAETYDQLGGKARSRGLELSAAWTFAEFATLTGAYTYTDAEQADGSARNRIPKHDIALALTGTVAERVTYDVNASFVYDLVDRIGVASEGFAKDYVVVNARLAYAVTDTAEVYLRAANLFDEEYQTANGYSTSDRALYAGVAARF